MINPDSCLRRNDGGLPMFFPGAKMLEVNENYTKA